MTERPNYGNWIRVRILRNFLLVAAALFVVGLLPLPDVVRGILLAAACIMLLILLYLSYVYYQFSDQGGDYQRKLRQLILDHLKWDGKGEALDIGTGNGALAIRLAQTYPDAKTTGQDLWADDWEYSKAVCDNNARLEQVQVCFEQGSAANLPYTDARFDAAVSHFVFHEIDGMDKRDVLREALRVVKKGGAFSFQDMFLDKTLYGEIPALLDLMRQWGIEDATFIPSHELLPIPALLRHKRVLGNAGLLFGRK